MNYDRTKWDAVLAIAKSRDHGTWGVEVSSATASRPLRIGGHVSTNESDALLTAAVLTGLAALRQKTENPLRVLVLSNTAKFVETVKANNIGHIYMPNQMKAKLQRAVSEYNLTFEQADQRLIVSLSNWIHFVVRDYAADFAVSTVSQVA